MDGLFDGPQGHRAVVPGPPSGRSRRPELRRATTSRASRRRNYLLLESQGLSRQQDALDRDAGPQARRCAVNLPSWLQSGQAGPWTGSADELAPWGNTEVMAGSGCQADRGAQGGWERGYPDPAQPAVVAGPARQMVVDEIHITFFAVEVARACRCSASGRRYRCGWSETESGRSRQGVYGVRAGRSRWPRPSRPQRGSGLFRCSGSGVPGMHVGNDFVQRCRQDHAETSGQALDLEAVVAACPEPAHKDGDGISLERAAPCRRVSQSARRRCRRRLEFASAA